MSFVFACNKYSHLRWKYCRKKINKIIIVNISPALDQINTLLGEFHNCLAQSNIFDFRIQFQFGRMIEHYFIFLLKRHKNNNALSGLANKFTMGDFVQIENNKSTSPSVEPYFELKIKNFFSEINFVLLASSTGSVILVRFKDSN